VDETGIRDLVPETLIPASPVLTRRETGVGHIVVREVQDSRRAAAEVRPASLTGFAG
jgi:hypothetical protein